MPALPNTTFEFSKVVFFGRRLEEYVKMFDLDVDLLKGKSVLDCAAGPASFALEAANKGITAVACDPMYTCDLPTLQQRVDSDARTVAEKQAKTPEYFHGELEPTSRRRQDMQTFLSDYENGKVLGRYVPAKLPRLPFEDGSFNVVLSANLLFLYSDPKSGGMLENSPFDFEFHSLAINELLRIATDDVRLYPLQATNVMRHDYLDPIMEQCRQAGHQPTVEPVAQRDIIGAEYMLRIVKKRA